MTPPIETLMAEHRFIEKLLGALAGYARRLGDGDAPREDLAKFVSILRDFADACHHGKEEDILFTAMVAAGIPSEGGPIAVMLREHVMGRAEIKAMADVAEGSGPFGDKEKESVTRAAGAYVDLLRAHIIKEDQILYPMAERVLPPEAWAGIQEQFDRFEKVEIGEGVHERLHALGEGLVERYGG